MIAYVRYFLFSPYPSSIVMVMQIWTINTDLGRLKRIDGTLLWMHGKWNEWKLSLSQKHFKPTAIEQNDSLNDGQFSQF